MGVWAFRRSARKLFRRYADTPTRRHPIAERKKPGPDDQAMRDVVSVIHVGGNDRRVRGAEAVVRPALPDIADASQKERPERQKVGGHAQPERPLPATLLSLAEDRSAPQSVR